MMETLEEYKGKVFLTHEALINVAKYARHKQDCFAPLTSPMKEKYGDCTCGYKIASRALAASILESEEE